MTSQAPKTLRHTFFQARVAADSRPVLLDPVRPNRLAGSTDVRCLLQSLRRQQADEARRHERHVTVAWSTHRTFPDLTLYVDPGFPSLEDRKPLDERSLRLGKTVSILHERLPTLLATPLPQDILSPQINLHLFPSTHPHLPTVSGRLSYTAALWTAPVAWGRVPVVGNVRLEIISERMLKNGSSRPQKPYMRPTEKLIVRWKTCGKDASDHGILDFLHKSTEKATEGTRNANQDAKQPAERDEACFTGLFIFEFDELGRISKHTIENAQQGGNWEKMTRVISVTDWLLGLAKRRRAEEDGLALGFVEQCPELVHIPLPSNPHRF